MLTTCVSKYFSKDVKSNDLFVLGTLFKNFMLEVTLSSNKMQFIQDIVNLLLSKVMYRNKMYIPCIYIYICPETSNTNKKNKQTHKTNQTKNLLQAIKHQ